MTALTVSKMDGVPTEMLLPEGFLNLGQTATYVPVSRLNNPRIVVAARSQNMTVMELGKCLLVAARDGRTEEVRDLMSKGAPFTTDWLGTSPLHLAASHNHVETCEVLLRAGICKDARTKVDRTPLHMAAYEGHKDVVELLLLNSADVDCRDMLKMTPLHWAVQNEHKGCVQLLLEYGASIDAVSKFEKTPVILAIEQNRPDILHLLQMSVQLASEKQHNVELQQATLAATQSITNTGPIDLDEDEDSGDAVEITKINMLEQAVSDHKFTRIHNGDDVGGSSDRETNSINRDTNETIRLLEAHGITMIPADDSSLVASAMESGQTVVLTEAGKLALNSTKPINGTSPNKIPSPEKQVNNSTTKVKGRKVITMRADQFLAMAGINSQMLKKVQQTKPVKRIVMAKNKIVVSPRQTAIQQSPEGREPEKELTLEEAKRQLIEAKKIAENYKCLLRQKDLEINEYKKQIELLKLQEYN